MPRKLLNILYAVALFASLVAAGTAAGENPETTPRTVVAATLDSTINPFTADFVETAINKAEQVGAEAVVIVLDTPGGLLNSTQKIVKDILNAPVPVVSYVSPSGATATSAGTFIVLASHIAAMAPGTSIGAAQPVTAEGKAREGKAGKKIENFASSYIKSIAKKRKRNTNWAVKAVTESSSVTWEYAVKKNIVDLVADDMDSLLKKIDGTSVQIGKESRKLSTSGAKILTHKMTTRQRMGNILGTPDIAYLLLSLGSLGILMEIYNPGSVFPGVVGIISLILAFASLQVLPFNYAGLGLIVVGSGLIVAEIFMTSYGLLALGGIISLLAGGVLLFDPVQTGGVGYDTLASVGTALGLLLVFVVYSTLRSPKISYLGGGGQFEGKEGRVVDWNEGNGIVFVGGEYWKAESDDALSKGSQVVVQGEKSGLKIKVKRRNGKSS